MEIGIAELILGYRVDALVGPIVVIGSGGVLSEVYDDKSVRIAPVNFKEAKMMISEVKSSIIFDGFRGLPKSNIEILAKAIVNISQLAFVKEVKEAEMGMSKKLSLGMRCLVQLDLPFSSSLLLGTMRFLPHAC